MALLLIDLVEPFTIVSWNYPRHSHRLLSTEFSLTHCSLPHTHGICISLSAYAYWNLCGKDTWPRTTLSLTAILKE